MLAVEDRLEKSHWENFKVGDAELEFIYNHLLEIETPLTSKELTSALIENNIEQKLISIEKKRSQLGEIYLPKNQYTTGQKLIFPTFDYRIGKVISVRDGFNPELPPFQVIDVLFDDNKEKIQLACGLEEHILNDPEAAKLNDPLLEKDTVVDQFSKKIIQLLNEVLEANEDLVRIADRWFPKALLTDVNIGHLNLAEALLDMEKGGPLPTKTIIEQIDLPTDANSNLTEFSLDYALQVDERFDEVGPAGEVLWFLRRYEPEFVQNKPEWLISQPYDYDPENVMPLLAMFDDQIADELDSGLNPNLDNEITLSLIYPHWRAGTLPLSQNIKRLFPTAFESPRIKFTFVDGKTGEKFPGWVVRPSQYVYGLHEWYQSNGLIPGSLVTIQQGKNPGEVLISSKTHRPTREWIRTIMIGTDGGFVFAMLKQLVSAEYNERCAIFIPDTNLVDDLWNNPARKKKSFEQTVHSMMRELVKLNSQGHVHAQELYAAVNIIRRASPGQILSLLNESTWATHLGDLYFRFNDQQSGMNADE